MDLHIKDYCICVIIIKIIVNMQGMTLNWLPLAYKKRAQDCSGKIVQARKVMATLSQLIRVQLTRFAEALTKDEVSSICFVYDVPEGERERRQSAIEVFRYLEKKRDLDCSNPDQLIALMQTLRREKWARETKELIGELVGIESIWRCINY